MEGRIRDQRGIITRNSQKYAFKGKSPTLNNESLTQYAIKKDRIVIMMSKMKREKAIIFLLWLVML